MKADIELRLLDPARLGPHALLAYDRLTEPFYRCCLRSQDPWGVEDTQIIAIGAEEKGEPVALALARFHPQLGVADLHTLYVAEPCRKQGIATHLLRALEEEIAKRRGRSLAFVYPSDLPSSTAYEKILSHLKWTPPLPFFVRLTFEARAFNPPWIQRDYHFPAGFEIFSWSELKPHERERLMHLLEERAVPDSVNPFYDEGRIEYLNSLGLRHKNEVVGWMITHRPSADTIYYTSLFIHREYKFLGHAIKLLARSIHLQKASSVPWAKLDLNLEMIDQHWLTFIKKRLLPYATKVERFKKSGRSLSCTRSLAT